MNRPDIDWVSNHVDTNTVESQHTSMLDINGLDLSINNKKILHDLQLSIYQHSINALIGPSGAGKTTLLHFLAGLSRQTVSGKIEGFARLQGIDVNLFKRPAHWPKSGLIFQQPRPFPISIYKNFSIPLKEMGIKHKKTREAIMMDVLNQVGLLEEINYKVNLNAAQLSGGQQQRLCIAQTLALNPKIVFLDEPCSALDPVSCRKIEDVLMRLREKTCIVLVTHNLSQAQRLADYTSLLWPFENGARIVESGRTDLMYSKAQSLITRNYLRGQMS